MIRPRGRDAGCGPPEREPQPENAAEVLRRITLEGRLNTKAAGCFRTHPGDSPQPTAPSTLRRQRPELFADLPMTLFHSLAPKGPYGGDSCRSPRHTQRWAPSRSACIRRISTIARSSAASRAATGATSMWGRTGPRSDSSPLARTNNFLL